MSGAHSWPVVVVHGPPGAGKSTLTRALASATGLPYFDRDEIKDTIFDAVGYSDREWSMRVGDASWELISWVAERLIRSHTAFFLESNFGSGLITERLQAAAADAGMTLAAVHVTADPEVLWDRFERRRVDGGRHPGHAGFTDRAEFLAELARRDFGPVDFGGPQLQLDTTHDWPDVAAVQQWLARLCC